MNEEIKFKDLLESFPENTKHKEESIRSLINPAKAVITDTDAGITIYSKGFIGYKVYKRRKIVIMNIHQCLDTYLPGYQKEIIKQFLNMKWQVPVALACEQRAEDNLTIIEEIRHRCNPRIDPDALANPDFLDYLFQKQYADALLEFLTPKEHEVIVKYYLGQETLQMIADAMHIKKQTVYEIRVSAINRMKKHL